MAVVFHKQLSFNGGELSPRLRGRSDIDQANTGLWTCQNFIPLAQGAVVKSPGFKYVAACKYSDKPVELIPFEFSQDQSYVLEFGDQYMRVYMDYGQVVQVDSYTKLLLHMEGSDGSTTFTDDGYTGHTVTANGNAQVSTTRSYFGLASGLFDGSGDYLSVPDHADFHFGSDAFCIDTRVYLTSLSDVHTIYAQDDSGTNSRVWFYVDASANKIHVKAVDSGTTKIDEYGSYTFSANTWYHIALIRGWNSDSMTWAICVDGQAIHTFSYSGSWPTVSQPVTIGGVTFGSAGDYDLVGNLDEYRVSKGVARWTADFTPPQSPYPAGGGYTPYEISTPYDTDDDISLLRTVQIADVMYIVHPSYEVRKLIRQDHDDWTLSEVEWRQPAWDDENTTSTTLTPSATTGTITLTASASLFTSDHVGAYFYLNDGYCRVTAVTDSTHATATVIDDFSSTSATTAWRQSAWDATQGYPSAIALHENRLVLAGVANHPLNVYFSETELYENMGEVSSPIEDDDPMNWQIWAQQQNAIKWLSSGKRLYIGTAGAEFWMSGKNVGESITPSSVLIRRETMWGSTSVQALQVGEDVLFVEKDGRRLRGWMYSLESDGYIGLDLSILAEHFTRDTEVKKLAFAQSPYGVVWVLMQDGTLAGMTYLKEHKVFGWFGRATYDSTAQGAFDSIATIPGPDGDELWVAVERVINGDYVRYIEVMTPDFYGYSIDQAFFVDSGLTYSGDPATLFSGLDHLEGETVVAQADGEYAGTFTVTNGRITLSSAASHVAVGLSYTATIEPGLPDLGAERGSSSAMLQRFARTTLYLYETGEGLSVGEDYSNTLSVLQLSSGLNTCEYKVEVDGDFRYVPTNYDQPNYPLPCTILALVHEVEIGGP